MNITGLQVVFDETLVEPVWEFPKERFVEYGPEDECWARRIGFGREILKPSPEAHRIGRTLVIHPDTFKAMHEKE